MTHENFRSGITSRITFAGSLGLEERLSVTNRNTKVRTAKPSDNGKGYADHFPLAIDQRPAGTAGSGLRIVDNFVGKDVADMTLRHERTDEFPADEFIDDFFWITAGGLDDFIHGFFASTRQDGAEPRGVAEGDERLAADRGLFPAVDLEDGTPQTG